MMEKLPPASKTQLALAIAQGKSVTAWARDNRVPTSTAYRWASDPEVRATVASARRRAMDRAIGVMAKHAIHASDQIAELARSAESESVRLRALRLMFSRVSVVAKVSDLAYRMAKIEQRLRDRAE